MEVVPPCGPGSDCSPHTCHMVLTKELGRLLAGARRTPGMEVVTEHVGLGPTAHLTTATRYLPRSWVDCWLERDGPRHGGSP
jgi:hypothetical protein